MAQGCQPWVAHWMLARERVLRGASLGREGWDLLGRDHGLARTLHWKILGRFQGVLLLRLLKVLSSPLVPLPHTQAHSPLNS